VTRRCNPCYPFLLPAAKQRCLTLKQNEHVGEAWEVQIPIPMLVGTIHDRQSSPSNWFSQDSALIERSEYKALLGRIALFDDETLKQLKRSRWQSCSALISATDAELNESQIWNFNILSSIDTLLLRDSHQQAIRLFWWEFLEACCKYKPGEYLFVIQIPSYLRLFTMA